jgi:hypothetical protein
LASFVETTLKDIDGRLRELRQEVDRLEAARSALSGARRGPGRPRGSTNSTRTRRRTATRRRAPGGRRGGATRANQALELVRGRPGITIPQIAEAMGIEPNYLYRVLPRLAREGQLKRDGQGWHPAS